MKGIVKQAEDIYKRVNCGYLSVSQGFLFSASKVRRTTMSAQTGIMVECHNTQCGPKHCCDILEGKSCQYRSGEVNPSHLYNPYGFDTG